MKKLLLYLLSFFISLSGRAQYYLRGEVKDEKNEYLQNVKITLHSDHLLYYSGSFGSFGIAGNKKLDSLTLSIDGFETKTVGVDADRYAIITLKPTSSNASRNRPKLISLTTDKAQTSKYKWFLSDESYFSLVENEQVDAVRFPNTGFSLNINKASYSNIRRFITMHSMVPPDAVRVEELLNYFNLNYTEPDRDQYFKIGSELSTCPWNEQNRLLYLNINAKKIDMDKVPPSNLVFLIDASGSMDMPNRLPLVKAAFQMLVKNLRPVDTVSIVIYGGTVAVWMQPTSGAEKQKITQSIEELSAQGDTPGESGIRLAYQIARRSFIKDGNNRVILATDGDFNVGETTEKALEDLVTRERQSGVYLTCLGVGMGNFKDSKLETLAKRGNGNYAYLDDIQEAEKVLVKEMTQTFFAVADDVFLNVSFNPALVKDYRLIGFDNKRDAVADSTGIIEGGEIGSGNTVMAIFEVTPAAATGPMPDAQLAEVQLRFVTADTKQKRVLKYGCSANCSAFKDIGKDLQFGAAVALFGLKLRQSKHIGKTDWASIESMATSCADQSVYLQKEFLQLIGSAKKIYAGSKKRKKGKDADE